MCLAIHTKQFPVKLFEPIKAMIPICYVIIDITVADVSTNCITTGRKPVSASSESIREG